MRRVNLESTIYLIVLLLALGLRFYNLGAAPLTDGESEWALQALHIARPQSAISISGIGPQPAYIFLTSASLLLFGVTNFMARFWPALVGSFFVLFPFFFRAHLGRTTALIFALGLALDPGLTAISRTAGSPMMAIGFGLLAIGVWFIGKPIGSGILAAMALLSGSWVFAGILSILLTVLAVRYIFRDPVMLPGRQTSMHRIGLFAGVITFLLIGTFIFRFPQGLAAWFESLVIYLRGWLIPSSVPAAKLFAALVFFQPLAVIFAFIGIIRRLLRRKDDPQSTKPIHKLLWVWAAFSLILAMLHREREVADIAWTLVPLWGLAALELSNYIPKGKSNPISFGQASLVFLFAVLFWTTLIATDQTMPIEGISWVAVRLIVLAGVIAIGVLTAALVALGWSWPVSRDGTVWGVCTAFVIYGLMLLWSSSQLRPHYPQEMWSSSPAIQQADLFEKSMNDLSNWEIGFKEHIDVVSTVDIPSLRWSLRDYRSVMFLESVPPGELPGIVITTQESETPALTAAYRGQDFAWRVLPGWTGVVPPDLVRWIAFREAPLFPEHIILWARSDIFPGGTLDLSDTPATEVTDELE